MEKNEFFGTKNAAETPSISTKTIFFEIFLIFFRKGIAFCFFMCYNNFAKRPVGQAVKTLASHAGNMGSIPVRVTRKRLRIGYNPESFSVKSACVGINPLRG